MSGPFESSEKADGLKEGFEKEGISGILKPQKSLSHMEGCLVLGKTAWYSMQMASQGALHWGPGDLRGVMRATGRPVGMGNKSTLPNQAWSGQRG